jgi:hypothetical protein
MLLCFGIMREITIKQKWFSNQRINSTLLNCYCNSRIIGMPLENNNLEAECQVMNNSV